MSHQTCYSSADCWFHEIVSVFNCVHVVHRKYSTGMFFCVYTQSASVSVIWFLIHSNKQHDAHDRKPKIKRLSFVFPCNIPIADDPNGIKLFGIGGALIHWLCIFCWFSNWFTEIVSGQLIASLKKMCSHLLHLKYLKLTDLVLERFDANHLLDEISRVCNQGLTQLELINITTLHCPMTQIGMFENLQVQFYFTICDATKLNWSFFCFADFDNIATEFRWQNFINDYRLEFKAFAHFTKWSYTRIHHTVQCVRMASIWMCQSQWYTRSFIRWIGVCSWDFTSAWCTDSLDMVQNNKIKGKPNLSTSRNQQWAMKNID